MSIKIEEFDELALMARLESAIADHFNGYKPRDELSEEHAAQLVRAVAWLASKYGD